MKHSYITSHPKILGGAPVVAGTRVPVAQLLYLFRNGSTIADVHNMYRHVPIDTIKKVQVSTVCLMLNTLRKTIIK